MDTLSYFAYGSNMDTAQMAVRCPGARMVGPACLEGYRFMINMRGVATVVPEQGALVHGVLWEIGPEDRASLDSYEGVDHKLYGTADITMFMRDSGEEIAAFIYVARDSTPGRPRKGYLDKIVRAGEKVGFPQEYMDELRNWGL